MNIGKRFLFGTLGFLSLLILGAGVVYAIKPGNCAPIEKYERSPDIVYHNPSLNYDALFVYGGDEEKSLIRASTARQLYQAGSVEYIIPLGTPEETVLIVNYLANIVPSDRIIIPDASSYSTRENIEVGYTVVRNRGLGSKIAHVSSRSHLPRIKRTDERLELLDPSDNGYFDLAPDTEYGKPFWQLLPNIKKIKTDSDLTEWYACATGR